MNDIENREDIELLVNKFYEKVHQEPNLAPVFEMPKESFENHLKRTYNFWDNWLFQTGNYGGGMMWVHLQKHQKTPLTTERFESWLALWFRNVDELFAGKRAEFVKKKALEIGQMMYGRLNSPQPPKGA